MYDDDADETPAWATWSWNLYQELDKAVRSGCVLRLSTRRPVNKPVIDRLIWGQGKLINLLSGPAFELGYPKGCNVPEGWRFAFTEVINHTDLVTLASNTWARHLKLQVLRAGSDTLIYPKQVVFNPATVEVVSEHFLEF